MSKITPGPWKACRSNEEFSGPYFEVEDGDKLRPFTSIQSAKRTIVTAHDLCEIREADAKLMAASPRLLHALEAAQSHLEWIGWGGGFERDCVRVEGLPEQIALAIAEARSGES